MFIFLKKQFNDINQKGFKEFKKKFTILLKFLCMSPLYLLGLFLALFIRLIKPFILVRIDRVSSHFGDFALWTFNYSAKKELRIDEPRKPFLDFIFLGAEHKDLYNSQILKMWRRKIKIYEKYPLHFIYTMSKLLPGWKSHEIKSLSQRPYYGYKNHSNDKEDQLGYLLNNAETIKFTQEEEIYGDKLLKKFGVKEKKKIVCFAIRDHAYSNEKFKDLSVDHSYHSYRHTSLKRFELAAKFLSNNGYYVFRMGRKSNERFDVNDKKIIDYCNSNLRSDFLDVFIGANCFFCLSTGYGYDDIPLIFGKPLAIINTPIIGLRARLNNQIFLTKHHYCKTNKKNLSLDEIFKKEAHSLFFSQDFLKKDIQLNDNSEDEIKDLVKEMSEILEKDFDKFEESELQIKFKKKFLSNLSKIDNKNSQFLNQKELKGRFSKYFLENNKAWLN